MGEVQNILLTLLFFLETSVLLYLEKKAWNTYYTPLNILSIPFAVVLAVCVVIEGRWEFVDFHYPVLLIWNIGLLLFAVPSLILAWCLKRANSPLTDNLSSIRNDHFHESLFWIGLVLLAAFLYRLYSMRGLFGIIAAEEFADMYAFHGLWSHLRMLGLVIMILSIYHLDKKHLHLWILIIGFLIVNFVNQVKGAIIIPCVTGILMRICTGKTRITIRLLLWILVGAIGVFMMMYIVVPVILNQSQVGISIIGFVLKNFCHYLTSGILGLSTDICREMPDKGDFEILFSQFVNIGKTIAGDQDLLSPVNPFYFTTGLNWTNVRTFFGTILIYSNYVEFVLYVLLFSTVMYSLMIIARKSGDLYSNLIFYIECGYLAMGWFEFYFFHLQIIELPIIALLLYLCYEFIGNHNYGTEKECAV